jgi:hypothetical protein
MRDILIIFIVLLLLLLIISTLGGSVRFSEKFDTAKPMGPIVNTLSLPSVQNIISQAEQIKNKKAIQPFVNSVLPVIEQEQKHERFTAPIEGKEDAPPASGSEPQHFEEVFGYAPVA